MRKQEFVITIYTENSLGLLSRIAVMFSRRRINIESLNVAASELAGVHRFSIMVLATEEDIKKLILQIDKQVDVLKSFYYTPENMVWNEQAFYKIENSLIIPSDIHEKLKEYGTRLIAQEDGNYQVFETTCDAQTTNKVLELLEPLGLTEFARSARIAIGTSTNTLHQKLKQFEAAHTG